MILKVKTSSDIPSSEITPEHVYRSRREFIQTAAAGALGAVAGSALIGTELLAQSPLDALAPLKGTPNAKFIADPKIDPVTSVEKITTYNNFYEFGTGKSDPARYASAMTIKPWTVKVDGLVDKPGDYGIEDLVDFNHLEERVHRHRCVERWSMVMPLIGVPLASVLAKVKPQSKAQFVEFTTLERASEMRGVVAGNLPYPYVEGLRMDEARHPLTFMVVGLYGKVLPNQNGAPLRVHIPWKYGFKSGKSIVRIRFTDTMPKNTWNVKKPNEYGFYANVNPNVPHPRWSQALETRFPSLFMDHPTVIFNGYGDQVADLYKGMDLSVFY